MQFNGIPFNIYKDIMLSKINDITVNNYNNNSLCSQFNLPSSQSIVSQLGFKTENSVNDFLNTIQGVNNLKFETYKINNHQVDILFCYKNRIFYFESKINMNMDTEKCIISKNKLCNIELFLKQKYRGKKVTCKFLNMWEHTSDCMDYLKFPIKKHDVYGYFDFFKIFGIQVPKNEFNRLFNDVKQILNNITVSNNYTNNYYDTHVDRYKHLSLTRQHTLLKRKYDEMNV